MKAQEILKSKKPPSILLYGPPGTQKTALVSQASGGYLLDFDDGMKTAATLKDKFFDLRNAIEFDTYNDVTPQKPRAWMDARKKIEMLVNESAAGRLKYDTIVVDSLTGMAKAIQLHVMASAGSVYRRPEIQHWGMMVHEVETALTMLRSIRTLRLVTAHELISEKNENDIFSPMSITKRHSINKLMWLFDEVWHTLIIRGKTPNFIVSGRSSSSIQCRTRSGFNEDFCHNDVGLVGLLKKIGYNYGQSEIKEKE